MNEEFIKKAVRYKLDLASSVADRLPPKMNSELMELCGAVLESINEYTKETKSSETKKANPPDKLNKVSIE
jgi:hypothetical protein